MDYNGYFKVNQIKNKIHLALRRTPHESPHYNTMETNLRNYNIILKKSIRLAKKIITLQIFKRQKVTLKKAGQL